jgi:HSP90 family molecular chaperone
VSEKVSFLTPDNDHIRHQICGILDSYSHDWDILAELAQNSVDAINRRSPVRGHIKVTVDARKRLIEFSYNGCGIEPENLRKFLRPFATDKQGKANQIGQ